MEVTDEMMEIIEAVKGVRNPNLWDPRCEQAMREKKQGTVRPAVKAVDKG